MILRKRGVNGIVVETTGPWGHKVVYDGACQRDIELVYGCRHWQLFVCICMHLFGTALLIMGSAAVVV